MENVPRIQIFNTSGIDVPVYEHDALFLLESIEVQQNCTFESTEVVYVPENEIMRINQEFLDRDYVTDIISFRLDEAPDNTAIEGILYCCASRIIEQAHEFNQTEKDEFLRVLIHGLIHLVGYNDQTEEEKKEMTRLEDYFLKIYNAR